MVSTLSNEIPTVYVGKKPLSTYLSFCFGIINSNKDRIWIEGMGQNITKAIDLVNFLRRFLVKRKIEVKEFKIDMIPKKEVHGLPKHVSRLRMLIEVREE